MTERAEKSLRFADICFLGLLLIAMTGIASAAPETSAGGVDSETWRWWGGGALGLMFLKEVLAFLKGVLGHERRSDPGDDTAKIITAIDAATRQHREAWTEQMKSQREELREMFEAFQEAQKETAVVTRDLTSVVERLGGIMETNCPNCRDNRRRN